MMVIPTGPASIWMNHSLSRLDIQFSLISTLEDYHRSPSHEIHSANAWLFGFWVFGSLRRGGKQFGWRIQNYQKDLQIPVYLGQASQGHLIWSLSCESHLPFALPVPWSTCPYFPPKEHSVFLVIFYAWQMYLLLTEEEKAHDTDDEEAPGAGCFG